MMIERTKLVRMTFGVYEDTNEPYTKEEIVKPLTDNQIKEIFAIESGFEFDIYSCPISMVKFARAIESKVRGREMNVDQQFLDAVEETNIVDSPSNEVIETGHKLYDFLKTIADKDGVDRGIGYGCYDLWATIDGKEVFIQVQKSKAQARKESH